MKKHILRLLFALCYFHGCRAFLEIFPGRTKIPLLVYRNVHLRALTDRQVQFWEDVDSGLNDIEKYYNKQGLKIDRIRRFGMR